MLRTVIWDFDGTICDTYPAIAHAVNTALARFGAQATLARVIELASISLERCIRTLAEDPNDPRVRRCDRHETALDALGASGLLRLPFFLRCFLVRHSRESSS